MSGFAGLSLFLTLFVALQGRAIVGGVTLDESLPSYLTAVDRKAMQSHTVAILNAQNPSSHSRCTGTLITKNVVLTAAHCIPLDLKNLFVVPSQYEFAVMARLPVIDKVIHLNYMAFDIPKLNQPNWDIALIRFEGELPEGYSPTSWINTFTPTQDRFWLFVAGYGLSDEKLDDTGELRFSRVTIEHALFNIQQSFMTGNQSNGEGICKGDSGGPAYMKIGSEFYVLGVVSANPGGCRGTSYFNSTVFFQNWIQDALAEIQK